VGRTSESNLELRLRLAKAAAAGRYFQYHDLSAQVFDRPIQYRNGLLARGFISYPFATRYLILPLEAGRRGR